MQAFPTTQYIPGLSTREAVIDALYRAVTAYDTYDVALHDSAFIQEEDTSFRLGDLAVYNGPEEIRSILHRVGPMDTTHLMTNPRVVSLDEKAGKARLTSTTLAQHYRPGEGTKPDTQYFLGGSLYDLDVERDDKDGLWKIRHFRMTLKWSQGDQSVVAV